MAGCKLSSANSINIGRLIPQVAYYVYAYARLLETGEVEAGEKINIVVPTGNFGNILAAYYAKEMGHPGEQADLRFKRKQGFNRFHQYRSL